MATPALLSRGEVVASQRQESYDWVYLACKGLVPNDGLLWTLQEQADEQRFKPPPP